MQTSKLQGGAFLSRKAKYTIETKIRAAERYLRGEASAVEIAAVLRMSEGGRRTILEWTAIYAGTASKA